MSLAPVQRRCRGARAAGGPRNHGLGDGAGCGGRRASAPAAGRRPEARGGRPSGEALRRRRGPPRARALRAVGCAGGRGVAARGHRVRGQRGAACSTIGTGSTPMAPSRTPRSAAHQGPRTGCPLGRPERPLHGASSPRPGTPVGGWAPRRRRESRPGEGEDRDQPSRRSPDLVVEIDVTRERPPGRAWLHRGRAGTRWSCGTGSPRTRDPRRRRPRSDWGAARSRRRRRSRRSAPRGPARSARRPPPGPCGCAGWCCARSTTPCRSGRGHRHRHPARGHAGPHPHVGGGELRDRMLSRRGAQGAGRDPGARVHPLPDSPGAAPPDRRFAPRRPAADGGDRPRPHGPASGASRWAPTRPCSGRCAWSFKGTTWSRVHGRS